MPNTSEKSKFQEFALMLYFESSLNENEKWNLLKEDEAMLLFSLIEGSRYLFDRLPVPRSRHWLDTILCNSDFNEKRFRQHLRCDRDAFLQLLKLIEGNEVFQGCQEPIPVQLAIALNKFGSYGNSAGISVVADKFGSSEGAVHKYTKRVIKALIDISQDWIKWPNPNEREKIGSNMVENLLPKCIGYIDGSDAVFYQAPIDDKETYWSRKKNYSMQFQIVCDPSKFIRHLFTGYPGSVHDAKVYQSSEIFRNENYFSNGEFIIGDSAYPLSKTLIVPYRRSANYNQMRKVFNNHISKYRVGVEHTIGILKRRFQSLRELRINVDKSQGHLNVCNWIKACVVLHNILMQKDPWNQTSDFIYEEAEAEIFADQNENHNRVIEGEIKRNALSEIINIMSN